MWSGWRSEPVPTFLQNLLWVTPLIIIWYFFWKFNQTWIKSRTSLFSVPVIVLSLLFLLCLAAKECSNLLIASGARCRESWSDSFEPLIADFNTRLCCPTCVQFLNVFQIYLLFLILKWICFFFQLDYPKMVEGIVLININPCAEGWMDWAAQKVIFFPS